MMRRETGLLCAAGLASALTALFVLACANGEEDKPGPGPYEPNEPKLVLANVEFAFGNQDADLLSTCLGGEFRFYFDLNDVGEEVHGYIIPEFWSKADTLRAVGNMFARTYATTLSANWRTMGSPGPGEKTYVATGVPLRIVVKVDEVNGYALDDGTCDYEFEQGDGAAWHLTLWRDRSRECGCVGELTLGRLLAGYYL
jgi:hypothetical protein